MAVPGVFLSMGLAVPMAHGKSYGILMDHLFAPILLGKSSIYFLRKLGFRKQNLSSKRMGSKGMFI